MQVRLVRLIRINAHSR